MSEPSQPESTAVEPTRPTVVYRQDYRPPEFELDRVELEFDLDPTATRVTCRMTVQRVRGETGTPWSLDGENLSLKAVSVDGTSLSKDAYDVTPETLTLKGIPDQCVVETIVEIDPTANKALSGLYRTSGNFCTQCEAQGFRRITFFPDRPDVMSRYRVTIRGDKETCPVMLSNGNRISEVDLDGSRHEVVWEDPHPKPSYLFALVAGDLKCQSDSFTTASGRKVDLEIWVEERNLDQCDHAMESLKKSMRWDEEVFGLEYDLDIYMIVAVDDFNMGAMENKGLNVFNSKFVLAAQQLATDDDFLRVEAVIAHEYFHNWTGNRVTCRDWFQLTLKEGLTVFRDQQFTADQTSAAVKRIDDVVSLRSRQFAEDSGPMAHPIRPESYIAMDNFYTATVYDKGAEIIRIYHTLLGQEGFRKGMDLYFQRHDNCAVTCDDFRAAMGDANQTDFASMDRWYSQPGTPELTVTESWDESSGRFALTMSQDYPPLPESIPASKDRSPVPIPVRTSLLSSDGQPMPASLEHSTQSGDEELTLLLDEREKTFVFSDLSERPTASVLRGFSAPLRLNMDRSDEELAFLMSHDSDSFNRWDAGQSLAMRIMKSMANDETPSADTISLFVDAIGTQLKDDQLDQSYRALLLTLPSESRVIQELDLVDPDQVHASRQHLRYSILSAHGGVMLDQFQSLMDGDARQPGQTGINGRRLKNTLLRYLALKASGQELAFDQYSAADNMTDRQEALICLVQSPSPQSETALNEFYDSFQHYPLVVDKWFAIQACSSHLSTIQRVRELSEHPAFTRDNPNRVRALVQTFATNPVCFHHADGSGYRFLTDSVVPICSDNPQLAARLVSRFNDYRNFEPKRQALMRAELERIANAPNLSKDVIEIVGRALEC